MKNLFLIAVLAVLGGVCIASAAIRYKVTVNVLIRYVHYKDDSYSSSKKVGESTKNTTEIITTYADTPHAAEQSAIRECSTMCQTDVRKKEGMMKYNGKYYYTLSFKEVYDATAVVDDL